MRSRSPQVPLLGGKRSAEPVSPHHQNISQNSQLEPISPTSPQAQNFSRPGRQLNPSSDPESHGERPNLYNQASMNTSRVMDPSQGYQQPQRYYQQASHPSSLTPGHQGQQPVHNSYSTPHQPSLSGQSSESLGGNGSGYPPRLSTAQSIRTAAAGIHVRSQSLYFPAITDYFVGCWRDSTRSSQLESSATYRSDTRRDRCSRRGRRARS